MTPRLLDVDVAIVGGGFSGSSTALLLRRANPALRILIVEQAPMFERKVGESAVELSSWFMSRALRLGSHLYHSQIPKYGLRFFFHNDDVKTLGDASEVGNKYQSRVPSFHIDRAVLDEHVLSLAVAEGAMLRRPARASAFEFRPGAMSSLRVESSDETLDVRARWVVDAAGRKAWLARSMGLHQPMPEHPTRAIWARYKEVRDFDGDWLPGRPEGKGTAVCLRALSTNHLVGAGYWIWAIPQHGGDTSIGLVWDERICKLPDEGNLGERFEAFIRSTPAGRELMQDAVRCESDLHLLKHLPFSVRELSGDGWASVGDAAGFIDPFYSPGLDWATLTTSATVRMILGERRGEDPAPKLAVHNREFTRGFRRWVEALYLDKYYYLGDAELMSIALRIDVAMYYFGIVSPPYALGMKGLDVPFGRAGSEPFFRTLRFVNRRLAGLAKVRLAAGTYGRRNAGRRDLLPGFKLGWSSLKYVPKCLAWLAVLELKSIPDRLRARRLRAAGMGMAALPMAADSGSAAVHPHQART